MKEKTFTKGSSRIALITMLFVMLAAFAMMMPLKAYAADIASGTYDGVDWVLTGSGTLEIGKQGDTQTLANKYRTETSNPWGWQEYNTEVKRVDFRGKVVAKNSLRAMFYGMDKLTTIENLDTVGRRW